VAGVIARFSARQTLITAAERKALSSVFAPFDPKPMVLGFLKTLLNRLPKGVSGCSASPNQTGRFSNRILIFSKLRSKNKQV